MRIVSQEGFGMSYDIPYEETVLKRYGEVILCVSKHLDREVTIAMYSTEAKAIKVMEMLREAYETYATLKDSSGSVHNAFVLPKVFKFPKDEDVEVEDET